MSEQSTALTYRRTLAAAVLWGSVASAQVAVPMPSPARPAVLDETVSRIPQTSPGSPWSFIGFAVVSPEDNRWFVTSSSPRGGVFGRSLSESRSHTALIVVSSELIEQSWGSDTQFLAQMRDRHAKLAERWVIVRHDEMAERFAGARCSRHVISARQAEEPTRPKGSNPPHNAAEWLHVTGMSCIHPTEPRLLIEVGLSERGPVAQPAAALKGGAEKVIQSLSFQRYSEAALQKAAEQARAGLVRDAEATLKPFIDADAAWARFFLAQILQRSVPRPGGLGERLRSLLEPAAERGLSDAQLMLGTLYLRGAPGMSREPTLAEALLRRAAERANPAAALQLGIALLSRNDGLTPNQPEAVLWITRAAARGQKEAQELLDSSRSPAAPPPPAR